MPRVPSYDLPSVGLQPRQGSEFSAPRVAPLQSAGPEQQQQLGRAMTAAGTAAFEVAGELQHQLNEARSKEAFTRFADDVSTLLHNPKDGYLNSIGTAAVGEHSKIVLDQIEEARRKRMDALDTDVQRELFNEVSSRHMIGVREQVGTHEAEQVRVYNAGWTKAAQQQAIRDAADAYLLQGPAPPALGPPAAGTTSPQGEPKAAAAGQEPGAPSPISVFERQRNTVIANTNSLADQAKLPADSPQRKLMVQAALTDMHSLIVDRLVAEKRGSEAKAYLDKVLASGDIDPAEAPKLIRYAQQASVDQEATTLADDIVSQLRYEARGTLEIEQILVGRDTSKTLPDGELDPTTMLTRGDEILQQLNRGEPVPFFGKRTVDAQVRSAAFQKLKEAQAVMLQQRAGDNLQTLDAAQNWLRANPNKSLQQLIVEQPKLGLKIQQRGAVRDAIESFVRNGHQYLTTPDGFSRAWSYSNEELASKTPVEVINELRGSADDDTIKGVLHRQQIALGDMRNAQLFTENEQIRDSLIENGDMPAPGAGNFSIPTPDQAKNAVILTKRIKLDAEAFVRTKLDSKRRPTGEEMQTIIDNVLLNKVSVGTDANQKQVVLLTPEERAGAAYIQTRPQTGRDGRQIEAEEIPIAAIPADWQAAIREGLSAQRRALGLPTNVDMRDIIEAWVAYGKPRYPAPQKPQK